MRKHILSNSLNLKNITLESFQFYCFYNISVLWDTGVVYGIYPFSSLSLKEVKLTCNLKKEYKNDLSIYIKMDKMLQCFGRQKVFFSKPKGLKHVKALILNLRGKKVLEFFYYFLFFIKPILLRKRIYTKYKLLLSYNHYNYNFSIKELNHFVDFFNLGNYDFYNVFINIFFKLIFSSNKFSSNEVMFVLKYLKLKR